MISIKFANLLALCAACACSVSYSSAAPNIEPGAIQISAVRLYKAYQDNELAADEQYKGKRLAVTGTVKDVGRELLGDPYVALSVGDDNFGAIPAYFSKSRASDLAKLHKGEVITVTCTGGGKGVGFPSLDCHAH